MRSLRSFQLTRPGLRRTLFTSHVSQSGHNKASCGPFAILQREPTAIHSGPKSSKRKVSMMQQKALFTGKLIEYVAVIFPSL